VGTLVLKGTGIVLAASLAGVPIFPLEVVYDAL
jgi:hypothetical protein